MNKSAGRKELLTSLSFSLGIEQSIAGRSRQLSSERLSEAAAVSSCCLLTLSLSFFPSPLSRLSLLWGLAPALSLSSVSPFVLSLSIYHTVKVERDVINLGE